MKPTEITMQIVKNLGNYETCRLEATYTLDENDDLTKSFITARKDIETAFAKAYGIKPELTIKSKEFDSVCNALFERRTTLAEVAKFFKISDDAMKELKSRNLI